MRGLYYLLKLDAKHHDQQTWDKETEFPKYIRATKWELPSTFISLFKSKINNSWSYETFFRTSFHCEKTVPFKKYTFTFQHQKKDTSLKRFQHDLDNFYSGGHSQTTLRDFWPFLIPLPKYSLTAIINRTYTVPPRNFQDLVQTKQSPPQNFEDYLDIY